ncbi:MAG: hypothetical protein ACLUEV_08125 [Alistipes sp.]
MQNEGRAVSPPDEGVGIGHSRSGDTGTDYRKDTLYVGVKNLHAVVDGEEILRGIDLSVRAGECMHGAEQLGQKYAGFGAGPNERFEVTEGSVFDG